jgi:hypothetical protein
VLPVLLAGAALFASGLLLQRRTRPEKATATSTGTDTISQLRPATGGSASLTAALGFAVAAWLVMAGLRRGRR